LGAWRREVGRDGFIYRAGEPAHTVGVVLRGNVLVVQEDYWGNRRIVEQVGAGGIFGEALACAQVGELPVSVVAATRCELLLMDYRRIATTCPQACAFHARLLRNMLGILARNNVQLTHKIRHITQRSTREKVLSYLGEQASRAGAARFEVPFNRQELADYLSVDRSALSAELSHMQADGLLRYHRNHFELLGRE
jgi:CRP-like cAMP-binding protein